MKKGIMVKFTKRLAVGMLCTAMLAGNGMYLPELQTVQAAESGGAEITAKRQLEALGRGLTAIKTNEGVYLSWRFLGTDNEDTSFELYRDGEKITASPITTSTNYLDASGTLGASYTVHTLQNGVKTEQSKPVSVWENNYLDIPVDKPKDGKTPDGKTYTYTPAASNRQKDTAGPNDAACGDLDGDGEYDIVLKWIPSNSGDNMPDGYRGNVYLDGYKMDGTKLWRIDLGVNIRAGAHYTPFLVYDFDGDGYAELICKTADGTVDGTGKVIGTAGKDWRNSGGAIITGPEYLTLFDGLTGAALDTIKYKPGRGIHGTEGVLNKAYWGDDFGNRSERYLAAVAYLNGKTPSALLSRGYYENWGMVAYDIVGKKFKERWFFDTATKGNEKYTQQGNHNLAVADVDNDGYDEIVFGGCTIDHDGTGLYSCQLGHGDAIHVGDFDLDTPGLEIFSCFEHAPYGAGLRKAATGEFLFRYTAPDDTGRGIAGNFRADIPGAEYASTINDDLWDSKGKVIGKWSNVTKWFPNFTMYWDGDLEQEAMERTVIEKYSDSGPKRVLDAPGVVYINTTKANSCLAGDLLGDWREEVIWPSTDGTFLRLFHTTYETQYRLATLMHDSQYRAQIATQNVGYNQPAHTSFFLGTGYELPEQPEVELIRPEGSEEPVEFDKKNLALKVGSTKKLNVLVSSGDTYDKKVTWSSSDEQIATVNDKGEVTAVAIGGPVTITATTESGVYQANCQVTVPKDAIPVSGMTISEKEYYFSEANSGGTAPVHRLTANIQPETATNSNVIWSSEMPEIATVDESGVVTAVSGGMAVITATTADGGFTAHTKVYVPSISENFENLDIGNTWDMEVIKDFENTAATLKSSVTADGNGKFLQLTTYDNKTGSSAVSGSRSLQKSFSKSVSDNKIILDFDWNVGAPVYSNGAYMAISDSNNNRYLSIQTNSNTELVYSTGGQPEFNVALSNTTRVGTGFNKDNAWYHLHVVLDMKARKTSFTISSPGNPKLKASHEVPFNTQFTGDVAAIQFLATRVDGTGMSWNPALDNLNIYKADSGVSAIKVNKDKVKLIPVKGTLGETCQLEASVFPSSESQEVRWESSNPSLVKVDANGLVTSAATYNSLASVKAGSCTIKVSSVQEPSVYTEIPVTISKTPNPVESFSIRDEAGEEIYPGGKVINLEPGEQMTFMPTLTGGDGYSDVAGLKWESSDSRIVSVDENGVVTALGGGKAKVTLTATLYEGEPRVAEIIFNIAGEPVVTEGNISAISLDNIQGRFWLNRKVQLTAEVEPWNVKEKVFWSSSDISVAVVDRNSGMLYPLGSGKATITAEGENGRVKASKEIEVVETSDLSSYFDEAGVKITATNTKPGREINNPFENARNNDWSGGTGGTNAWSTGSSEVGVITIDLGAEARIDDVKTVFYSEMKYTLDVSDDGEHWTTKVDHSGQAAGASNKTATEPFTDTFPAGTTARYVRLNIIENTGGNLTGMTYMQVNGAVLPEKTFANNITCQPAEIEEGGTVTTENLPGTVSVVLSNGETTKLPVVWDAASLASINGGRPGVYDVTGTVTVDGISYYVICKLKVGEEQLVIEKDLKDAVVTLTPDSYVYDGKKKTPAVTVELNGEIVPEDGYTVEYRDNIDVGTAKVEITGKNGYTGKTEATFVIAEASAVSLEDAVVTLTQDSFVYDGNEKTPAVTVRLNGKVVPENGYTVKYKYNINVGTATVVVTGHNDYYGTIQTTFMITEPDAVDLKDAVVTLTPDSYVYDGKEKTPAVTVELGGQTVPEDGYTVEYKDNIDAGTAKVEITGKNGYSGKAEGTFTITKASATIQFKKAPLKVAYGSKNFALGASVNSKGKLTYKPSNKTVIKMVGSKAKIIGCGNVTVTVKAAETANYKAASKKLKITVMPKKVTLKSAKSKKAGQVTVSWKKATKVNGYTIKLSLNKKFKGAKMVKVKSYKTTAKTINGLKKGKTYYVKVCAYKTVKGKPIAGFDSAVKKVKIKK